MKILVISDSHKANAHLKAIIDHVQCDCIYHAGDSCLEKNSPLLSLFETVRGNHDFDFLPLMQSFRIHNKRILLVHGHTFNVYGGYELLYAYMKEHNYDICFHGHTHIPHKEEYKGKLFVNPGSIYFNRGELYGTGTYAIVDITDTDTVVTFYDAQNHTEIPYETIEQKTKGILKEFKRFAKFHI